MVNFTLMITAELENLTNLQPQGGCDDPDFSYLFKCKFCGRDGTVTMIEGKGKPLTQEISESGKYAPLMLFDCRGYEPVDFVFGDGWKVESLEGTKFENVDLSSGEYADYDEKGECPVMISALRATFEVTK
ncbi:uncharacterized protein LOC108337144 isoform X2 [Vigna angularis]|uniref:uncharacterized protein LOC108337144 isoform X2 n=1 Tax=Phaseolus angularis TaxID=3914 RepID=UPI000809FE6F|nr:uncharacterized protein LOC108337144 isoform X2 [Vigna angularis]